MKFYRTPPIMPVTGKISRIEFSMRDTMVGIRDEVPSYMLGQASEETIHLVDHLLFAPDQPNIKHPWHFVRRIKSGTVASSSSHAQHFLMPSSFSEYP